MRIDLKVYVSLFLIILAVIGAFRHGDGSAFLRFFVVILVSLTLDTILRYITTKRVVTSLSAFITAMIVLLALGRQARLSILLIVSCVVIAQKYLIGYIRTKRSKRRSPE